MKSVWALALLAVASPGTALADRSFLEFDGGIGVIPVSNVNVAADGAVTVNRNIVRGVNPAGQIWVIEDFEAKISRDGEIRAKGKGLLLGGGNNIGHSNNANVFATLICETEAPFTERSTDPAGVRLDDEGDFKIRDVLTPWPPGDCDRPVLLIRNAANLGWFMVGIPDLDHDDGRDGDHDGGKHGRN